MLERENLPGVMGLGVAEGVVSRSLRETEVGLLSLIKNRGNLAGVLGKSRAANYRALVKHYTSIPDVVMSCRSIGDQTGKKKNAKTNIELVFSENGGFEVCEVEIRSKEKTVDDMHDAEGLARFSKHAAARYLQTLNKHLIAADPSFKGFVQDLMQHPTGFIKLLKAGGFMEDLKRILAYDTHSVLFAKDTVPVFEGDSAMYPNQIFEYFTPLIYSSAIGEFRFKGYFALDDSDEVYLDHIELVTCIEYEAISSSVIREKAMASVGKLRVWEGYKEDTH